ncbi:MAG: hypothetical protein Q9221_007864 [Calogaya cf. arnoldii]
MIIFLSRQWIRTAQISGPSAKIRELGFILSNSTNEELGLDGRKSVGEDQVAVDQHGILVHAESALAAQQNVSTRPYPALPTAAFDADNMALWSQPMGVQQSTPERIVTPYPAYGQTPTTSMDFANPAFYPFPPNPNLPLMNVPMPPLNTAAHGSSTTSLPQLGDTSTTFPLKEPFSDGSDAGKLQNPGLGNRNWTGSSLSSRITTPGTSVALSEALDTIPQHVANDL